jgi:hypothetical protein
MRNVLRQSIGASRTTWLRLLAGTGLLLGLAVPAQALVARQSSSRSGTRSGQAAPGSRRAAAAAPKCSSVYYDSSADAPDIEGQQTNNLDLVQTTLGLNRADTKLRVVMIIKNLSKKPPAPANDLDYQIYWTNPSGDTGPNALDAAVNGSGTVTYSAGTTTVVNGNTSYAASKAVSATGTFGSGPNGKVEIDVPLSQMGLKVGQVLTGPVAYTADGNSSLGLGSIADRDPQTGGGNNYKVDQKTCIDSNA